MTIILFSVYDAAAGAWLAPFCAPTVEVAIRNFRATVNRPESQFHMFPQDYTLFSVGEFDQETGLVKSYMAPNPLGVAVTFLERPLPTPQPEADNNA